MQNSPVQKIRLSKIVWSRWLLLAAVILGVSAVFGLWLLDISASTPAQPVTVDKLELTTVTALGRLAPQGEVIKLSGSTANQGSRIDRLLVQEGDSVKVGQVLALLDSHDRLEAALAEAEAQVSVAQAKLVVIQAGAKQGELAAQRAEIARLTVEGQGNLAVQNATVARLQSELQNAQTEYIRYQALFAEGGISASQHHSKRLTVDTAQKYLNEAQAILERIRSTSAQALIKAKATLAQVAEVRPVDIRLAQTEVTRTRAARRQAQASLAQSEVRSPIDGEVLYIRTRAGEVSATEGIMELGQTRQMQAIAEVYQSDVRKVQSGQRVRVTSESIPGELKGTVARVGSQVRRQTIVNTDPSTNIDGRVVEVHVTLDAASSQKAAKFTNLQVQVVIEQ